MTAELRVPAGGESIREVQVGEWRKADGDYVERDEILVEIETDKAAMELPAPTSGRLKINKRKGEIVPIGEVLATIEEAPAPTDSKESKPYRPQPEQQPTAPPQSTRPVEPSGAPPQAAQARVMPAARREMAQAGVAPGQVTPSGPGGRILKEDVYRAAAERRVPAAQPPAKPAPPPAPVSEPAEAEAAPAPTGPRYEEAVPMSMLRRRVAQRLVEAKNTAAMLTTFNEVDCSAMNQLRKEHSDAFESKYGIRLGLMSFFVKASIDALKAFPQVNAEVRGNDIMYKNYYDIGVAVSTDRGLVVPVLRNAELMSFAQVEQTIADLAVRARDNKLSIEELEGGTFTITNGGIFGSLLSTPILNPPQSGILGLHAMQERPVARDGQVVIRPMMYLALTYDHRIVDGREAVSFLRRVRDCIESPARMLLEA